MTEEENTEQQLENLAEQPAKNKKVLIVILAIIAAVLFVVVGYFFLFLIPQPVVAPNQEIDSNATSKEDLENVDWQTYTNEEFGFEFRYPQSWKTEGDLSANTCCLNIFNSISPYQGDFLKQAVMKAQFQYHGDASISSKQQYIDSLVKGAIESKNQGEPTGLISRASIVSVQNENNLDILKFTGGAGAVGYVVPRKQSFSEVLYVVVWNPDPTFEEIVSSLKFFNSTSLEWKIYRNEEIGVEFSYPSDYQITYDAIRTKYVGHPQGFNWYKVELEKNEGDQSIYMTFEVDADGYGPFFPDKGYSLLESSNGRLLVGDEYIIESENNNDGKTFIIPDILKSINGHTYSWQFSFNEGEKDFEQDFKDILNTFKFIN